MTGKDTTYKNTPQNTTLYSKQPNNMKNMFFKENISRLNKYLPVNGIYSTKEGFSWMRYALFVATKTSKFVEDTDLKQRIVKLTAFEFWEPNDINNHWCPFSIRAKPKREGKMMILGILIISPNISLQQIIQYKVCKLNWSGCEHFFDWGWQWVFHVTV